MANNEVFTSRDYIERLDKKFNLIDSDIVDNCCGHGAWLKYAKDKGYKVWGCDIVPENCIETIKLLYGEGEIKYLIGDNIPEIMRGPGIHGVFEHNRTLITNIVCADSLKYSMNFDSTREKETFGPNNLFTFE